MPGTFGNRASNATFNSSDRDNNGKVPVPIVDGKIGKQLPERGWTKEEIQSAVNDGATGTTFDKRSASKTPDGLSRNDPATVYGSKGSYVVVNDRTGEVVQISDKNNPNWIVDGRIRWKGE